MFDITIDVKHHFSVTHSSIVHASLLQERRRLNTPNFYVYKSFGGTKNIAKFNYFT